MGMRPGSILGAVLYGTSALGGRGDTESLDRLELAQIV